MSVCCAAGNGKQAAWLLRYGVPEGYRGRESSPFFFPEFLRDSESLDFPQGIFLGRAARSMPQLGLLMAITLLPLQMLQQATPHGSTTERLLTHSSSSLSVVDMAAPRAQRMPPQ